MNAFVELRDVSKSYDSPGGDKAVEVFSGVNLELTEGETAAIVGPSGSGKSTLLNVIGALDKPSGGEVLVDGRDVSSFSPEEAASFRNQTVGFIFQTHHLLPQCTILENVMVPALAGYGELSGDALRERAEGLLEEVGLSNRLHHRPAEISGGESQRVAVARALVNDPKLLLADEPTGALDKANSDKLVELLVSLNDKRNLTLLAVTHSAEVASRMGATHLLDKGGLISK
ncbi:MAG: ABC transporter [Opitutales bacterium]|jgi:ABC-type lipoprotein export system ATPase subunit|nr:ABC transporter [Opitutales bacterium]